MDPLKLRLTAGTNLYEAFHLRDGPRFAWWPATAPGQDELTLAQAWAGKGVFAITAGGDATAALERFCEVRWAERKGSKVIAWRQGEETNPLRFDFDDKGQFVDGTDRDLVEVFIGAGTTDQKRLILRRAAGAAFSVDIDTAGNALRFISAGGAAFQLLLGGTRLEMSEDPPKSKVFAKIAVEDGVPGSGAWMFRCAKASSARFLGTAVPMMRFAEPREVHRAPLFDIAASASVLAGTELSCRFHPFAIGPAYAEVRLPAGTALVSQFLDTAGRQVRLESTDGSVLYLQENPQGAGPRAHLAPAGLFKTKLAATKSIQVAGTATAVMEMLAGGSGTEFIHMGEEGGTALPDSLLFVPASPAYVRYGRTGEPEWMPAAKTSWVAPVHASTATASYPFTTQPQEAPLFGIKAKIGNRNAASGLRDTPGMAFDLAPLTVGEGDTAIAMPLLPIGGVPASEIDSVSRLDRRALVPKRRLIAAAERLPASVLRGPGALASPPPLRWVVMPQGYSVALDDANRWWKVSFAVATGQISAQLVLARPTIQGVPVERWPVEEALAQSATFIVATRLPDHMPDGQGPAPDTPMEVAVSVSEWRVKLHIGSPARTIAAGEPPVLVIKLGGKRSFRDLAASPVDWSLAQVFNRDPVDAQGILARTVSQLEGLTKRIPPEAPGKRIPADAAAAYKLLYEKLDDPQWNGVVLFNGISDVDDLPGGVAALKAGVETGRKAFWAPCLGLDLCKVVEEAQVAAPAQLAAEPPQVPSFFAGVHFFDPQELPSADPGFKMKLKSLDVVLYNSALHLFLAKADLRVSDLFGAQSKDTDAGDRRNRIIAIEGSYQGRSAEGDADQYLIRALGTQNIDIDADFLQRVQLTRLELGSRKKDGITYGRFGLWGELGFGGGVTELTGVKSVKFDNLSISVTIEPDRDARFNFDAGHIDVDWKKSTSGTVGWLDKFPLKLGGLRWGGGDFARPQADWPKLPKLELGELGFSDFGVSDLAPKLGTLGTAFDFGLEFDMDLGGFGGMTDAAKLLRGKVLLGWLDFRRLAESKFAVGFRFEGGSGPLDIGIQGVIRLKAKKAILKRYKQASGPELLGIGLEEPQLEVLGYKVPEKPKKDLRMALVVELGDGPRKNSQPTWVFAAPDAAKDPVRLDYFAIGQNAMLLDPASVPAIRTVADAVRLSRDFVEDRFGDEGLDELRPAAPSGKWNLVADGAIVDGIANVKLVFLDDIPLYGLHVEAPIAEPLFAFDILYKKIAEDLGVFSIEVDLKGLRTFELGVGSLTLPIFTFRKFTNEDWDLNFGFNYNDFRAAATLQAFPFLGSAALRLGQLSGRSGNFLLAGASDAARTYYRQDLDLAPVYEIQMAFRVGIGKEIRQGIFSAGASLSIYGIFQGALGTINAPRAKGRRYVKLAGAAGILLEVFGEVNFSLVSAAVCIRAWVETGLVLETWHEIAIYAEAGVSVYVRFVIARFRVFSKTIEIAVHFSFSTTLRVGATLPYMLDKPVLIEPPHARTPALLAAPGVCLPPIDWKARGVVGGNKLKVLVAASADPQIGDSGAPVLLPMLALVDGHPQGRPALGEDSAAQLVVIALRWALGLSKPATADPATVTVTELRELLARMRGPGQKPASRWKTTGANPTRPLDYGMVREFLALNVELWLHDPATLKADVLARLQAPVPPLADADPLPGVVMPWLRELGLRAGTRTLRDFTQSSWETIDEAWEAQLRKVLAQGRPHHDPLDPCHSEALATGPLSPAPDPLKRAMLDILLEDWFASLVEGVAYRALQQVEKKGGAMPAAELEAELMAPQDGDVAPPALQVAQQAGSIMMHAMRVPAAGNAWVALTARSGLEIPFGVDGLDAADTTLEVVVPSSSWIKAPNRITIKFASTADAARTHLEQLAASAMARKPQLHVGELRQSRLRTARAIRGVVLNRQDGAQPFGTLFNLPAEIASLQAEAREPGQVPATGVPFTFGGLGEFSAGETLASAPAPAPVPGDADAVRVGGVLKMSLRRVNGAGGTKPLRGVYGINGGGEVARLVLQSWQAALARLQPERFVMLWNPASGEVPDGSAGQVPRAVEADVQFFVTNLSTEANPDARVAAVSEVSVVAGLDDPAEVRAFLWKTALVNSDGFFVAFGESNAATVDQVEAALDAGRPADISIAWLRKPFKPAEGELHPYETILLVEPRPKAKDLTVGLGLKSTQEGSGVPDGMLKLLVRKDNLALLAAAADEERELRSRYAYVEYAIEPQAEPEKSLYVAMPADECTPLPLQAPDNDKARPLDRQEPDKLEHHLLIPVLNFAKANRDTSGRLLTDPDALNPYALMGTDLAKVLKFGLRDGAGHRYGGPVDVKFDSSLELVYREPLRPFSAYPGLSLGWYAERGAAHAKLTISLAWALRDKQLRPEPVATARKLFRQLSWMLQARGTKARALFRMQDQALASLPENEVTQALVDFCGQVLKALKDHVANPKPALAYETKLEFKVPQGDLAALLPPAKGPRLLEAIVALEREEGFYDKGLAAGDPTVRRIDCEAAARADGTAGRTWAEFAADFENAFAQGPKPVYLLKLPGEGGVQSCWVALSATILDCVNATRQLVSFAPRPLSTEFRSGEAQLLTALGEKPLSPLVKTVADVDLDLLAARYLEFIENVLQPEAAHKMCILSGGSFEGIMRSKSGIANAYADRLLPIEAQHLGIDAGVAVRDRFVAAAAANLKRVYELGAICHIDSRPPVNTGSPTTNRVFGEIVVVGAERPWTFDLSNLRLPLDGASPAAFSVFWKGGRRSDAVKGDTLRIKPRYVECQWTGDGFGKYIPSRWFELLSPAARTARDFKLAENKLVIPLPLRELPATPHIHGHRGIEWQDKPASLQAARRWVYTLDAAVPVEEHDRATFTVQYEAPPPSGRALGSERTLFDALVTFDNYQATLAEYLGDVLGWQPGTDPSKARLACECIHRFVADFAGALARDAAARVGIAASDGPLDRFAAWIKETTPGRHQLTSKCVDAAGTASGRTAAVELTDITKGVPVPVTAVASVPIADPAPNKSGSADYTRSDDAVRGISGLSGRRLTLQGLDIFQHATATPQVLATRNEELGDVAVSREFIFTTGTAKAQRLVPRLGYTDVPPPAIGVKPLADHLAAIGDVLLGGASHPLSLDAHAVLRLPYPGSPSAGFTYPLSSMKGQAPAAGGSWAALLRDWGVRLESAMTAKAVGASPVGVELSLAVYAEKYAGSRPVLLIEKVLIPWAQIARRVPSFGAPPPAAERVEDLAAIVFALTEGLQGPRAGAQDVQEVRNAIAVFVRERVPSLNVLDEPRIPQPWELREEAIATAWSSCVEAAGQAFAQRATRVPLAWALEPAGLADDLGGLSLWENHSFLADSRLGVDVEKVGGLRLQRRRQEDVFEGSVNLVTIMPARPPLDGKARKRKGK